MKFLLFAAIIFSPAAHAKEETRVLEHGGFARSYLLRTNDAKPVTALVFMFHGGGQLPAAFQRQTEDFSQLALAQGFALALPTGINGVWEDGRPEKLNHADDIGFMRKLVKALTKELQLKKKNIFTLGFSNGAGFVLRLGCEMPDILGGGVAVSMNMPAALAPSCQAPAVFPLLLIETEHDPVVPIAGGRVVNHDIYLGEVLSAEATAKFWKIKNGNPDRVTLQIAPGNQHEWPGARPHFFSFANFRQLVFGRGLNSLAASNEAMRFFLARLAAQ